MKSILMQALAVLTLLIGGPIFMAGIALAMFGTLSVFIHGRHEHILAMVAGPVFAIIGLTGMIAFCVLLKKSKLQT